MLIVLASNSGGVGKSTLAQHLSQYLATSKRSPKTLLVDADRNQTSVQWAARGPGTRFDVLSSDRPFNPQDYAHIVLDTAAAPATDELAELVAGADLLIVPSSPSPFDLLPAIATAQEMDLPRDRYTLLVTLAPPTGNAGSDAIQAVQAAKLPVVPLWIGRRNCYLEAAVEGVTVDQIKGAKKAWAECEAVFKKAIAL